jgi:phage shock protein A
MSELKTWSQWREWLGYRFRLAQDAPSYNQFSSILGDMAETIETAVRASDTRIAELEAEVERLRAQLQQSSPQPDYESRVLSTLVQP